jgi:Family of unknown function (DUF6541)
VASVSGRAREGLRLPALSPHFVALILAAPIVLAISRLLPAEGAGLGLRLAAAAACVLFVPGALVLRAIDWPVRAGLVVAGSLSFSLLVVFLAMALTFAAGGSLSLTIAVIGIVSAGALLAAVRAESARLERSDLISAGGVVCAGLFLCGAVWWASTVVEGDALFHLARARKLEEMPVLSSVNVVNEFRDGGLHAGYAFPLWHGVLALVARLGGVDVSLVVLHLSALLAPLALVLSYAAGAALFASAAGGVATAAAQAALLGFPRNGIGSFEFTALPASAARLLLVPALLALVFTFVRGGPRSQLVTIAAAAFGLAVVHPSYAAFVALPLGAFVGARLLLSRRGRSEWRRLAAPLVVLLVPAGLFLAWLWPSISETESFTPAAGERARGIAQYAANLDVFGDSFRLAPEAITRGGPAVVAALLAVPAAVLAARRRWAALVLGGTVAVLVVLLVPRFFTALADLSSLSQARRLALFLPLAFALAGAAVLAGRLRLVGCVLALGLGIGFQVAFPPQVEGQGPAWPVWLALGGGAAALLAGRFLGRRGPDATPWSAAAALLFVLPIAVVGLSDLKRDDADRYALTPGLVEALRTEVPLRATVFADLETSYRIAANAPVYVAAAPPAHVASTPENRPYERRADVIRFFYRDDVSYLEKAQILSLYGASWLVVDKSRKVPRYVEFLPRPVYEDDRYALYYLRR